MDREDAGGGAAGTGRPGSRLVRSAGGSLTLCQSRTKDVVDARVVAEVDRAAESGQPKEQGDGQQNAEEGAIREAGADGQLSRESTQPYAPRAWGLGAGHSCGGATPRAHHVVARSDQVEVPREDTLHPAFNKRAPASTNPARYGAIALLADADGPNPHGYSAKLRLVPAMGAPSSTRATQRTSVRRSVELVPLTIAQACTMQPSVRLSSPKS